MKTKNIILSFLWQVIKPYKWWYLLMMMAPTVDSLYLVCNNYALKLIIDAFTTKANLEYLDLLYPISLFVGSLIVMETLWRLSQFAWMNTQPLVRADIVAKSYDYVQHHSYAFFQNMQTGSIVSKIKGIVDGYNSLWQGLHHRITKPLFNSVVIIIAIGFINIYVFAFMAIWCVIFSSIMLIMSIKISKLAGITSEAQHKAIGMIADNITNIFTLFSFAKRKQEYFRLKNFLLTEPTKKDRVQIKYELKYAITGGILYIIMLVSLFIFMIYLRRNNLVTTGGFVFVMTTTYFLVESIWNLMNNVSDFLREMGNFKSSFSILQTPQEVIDKKDAKELII
ncbi:MAG: ABC transporter transmembrane domain-containing protein [Proteobacteria bacterium]|nr:ABC transporter transmembrane domain-containing protein [Pseudomonadota bacterium]